MTADHRAAAIAEITRETGASREHAQRMVKQHGPVLAMAALDLLTDAEAGGTFKADDPIAYMFAKITKGEAAAKVARELAPKATDPHAEWLRHRYCEAQRDPTRDTATRRGAKHAGEEMFVCGVCGEECPTWPPGEQVGAGVDTAAERLAG